MIHFLKGDDPTLVAQALSKVVDQLVGDGEKTLMVDEITEAQMVDEGGPASISALVTSAQTPLFSPNVGLSSAATSGSSPSRMTLPRWFDTSPIPPNRPIWCWCGRKAVAPTVSPPYPSR